MNIAEERARIEELLGDIPASDRKWILDRIDAKNAKLDKKYGLVFEEGSDEGEGFEVEGVARTLESHIPVPVHRPDLSMAPDPDLPIQPTGNLLLEGDNLHWLTVLQQTHKERIDVIYIDPPYSGGRGLVYNDNYVDIDDRWKHSKWLSFMSKRLKLAWNLLRDNGVIFISIDDDEQAQLKLLCDEVFGNGNFLENMIRKTTKGAQDSEYFARQHEYVLCYAKNKASYISGKIRTLITGHNKKYNKIADDGRYYKLQQLRKWGDNERRIDRPDMYYAIKGPDGVDIYPKLSSGEDGCWRWMRDTYEEYLANGLVSFIQQADGSFKPYQIQWEPVEDYYEVSPYSSVIDGIGSESTISKIFGEKVFEYPKPVALIKKLLSMATDSQDILVLDFFAGSGTTAHAVNELNNEDGGTRQWIAITSNELDVRARDKAITELTDVPAKPIVKKKSPQYRKWLDELNQFLNSEEYKQLQQTEEYASYGICRAVTKPRIDAVITGIRPDGEKWADPIGGSYDYCQLDWLDRANGSVYNIRRLSSPPPATILAAFKEGVPLPSGQEEAEGFQAMEDENKIVVVVSEPDARVFRTVADLMEGRSGKERIVYVRAAFVTGVSSPELNDLMDQGVKIRHIDDLVTGNGYVK